MVNHSQEANTYFEETLDGDVRLLIRRGYSIKSSNSEGSSDGGGGDEITIDYGQGKSAAEMLFSYGFVDSEATARSLVLPLESMNDDPLAKAKLHVFDGPPVIKLEDSAGDAPTWTAPFVYLMCLNEDDGIDFQVVQTIDGGRQLVLFWQGEDVTNKAANFETLISGHDLEPIIHLRAITVLITQLTEQVEKLETPLNCDREPSDPRFHFSLDSVWQLRRAELDLMQRTLAVLENQVRPTLPKGLVIRHICIQFPCAIMKSVAFQVIRSLSCSVARHISFFLLLTPPAEKYTY